jgi:thymidylate synthase
MADILGVSFDDIFVKLLRKLSRNPDFVCAPRGQKIKEDLALTLVLTDPRSRFIHNPARKSNYGFAAGEFLWYWQGRRDLEMMLYYNRRMKDFSDDGITLNSAYGHRLRAGSDLLDMDSQWNNCIATLSGDSDSRRAVMTIFAPIDADVAVHQGSKDVPCTLSLQFFIRDNCLHLHVHMRSNDAIWGLTNDLFSFTLFQECMFLDLKRCNPKFADLKLGQYYHTAGSLHLYERHFEMAEEIIKLHDEGFRCYDAMPALTSIEALDRLGGDEEDLRKRYIDQIQLSKYEGGELWLADELNVHRQKRDAEESLKGDKKAG